MPGEGPSNQSDRVVEETYAATLEPERYDALLAAWYAYIAPLPDNSDEAFRADNVSVHFERALAILDRMGRVQARDESARAIVEQMPGPALVMKPEGEILGTNTACLGLLEQTMPTSLADLQLDPAAMTAMRNWLKRNSPIEKADEFLFVSTLLGPHRVPSRLLVTRISLLAAPGVTGDEAILVAAVEVYLDRSMADRLSQVYGLSQAELDVAFRLARGEQPARIASDRSASLPTVRSQIRNILSKLDVASVTEAVRLLTGFGATMNMARSIARQVPANRDIDRWRSHHKMTLPDGRQLAWMEQGDPAGRPVLFFHHLYHGPGWTEPAIEALARQGWRVIAPSRPGFGESDMMNASTPMGRIEANVDSITQLCQRLEIGPVIIVAHAGGLIYAQAFAAMRPHLARGLLSVGGETSWEPGMERNLPWAHKVMATTLLRVPSAMGFLARATVAFIDTGREDVLLNTLHRDSPLEQRISRRPEVKSAIMEGLRHTVRQGANGFVSEIRITLTDRRDTARQVRCPFHIVHGLKDSVFKPEMFSLFADTVPGVRLVPVEDAGQYLLYSHWPAVLSQLEAMWRETAHIDVSSESGPRLA